VTQWHQHNIKGLLCLNANEDIEALNPIQELEPLIARTNLANTHKFIYPQHPRLATYHQGTQPTDIFLALSQFLSAIQTVYILPVGQPITMPSNRHTLGIDFDT